jgi:hypothetical protein
MRDNIDGGQQLAPYNLISAWYWVYDDANGAARPGAAGRPAGCLVRG